MSMICGVYDGLFDDLYLHQLDSMMNDTIGVYPNNIANRTSWPMGYEGSHRLLGRVLFDRKSSNRITILHPSCQWFFDIFERIEGVIGREFYLSQIMVNLQPTGCHGTTHVDSSNDKEFTIIMMTTPKWDLSWGGQFQLINMDGTEVVEEQDYVPGRVLVVPSTHPHRGLGPTQPNVYRTSVVFRSIT